MRFIFSHRERQPLDTHYTYVKAGLSNTHWDLLTTLLSGSLTSSSAEYQAEDLHKLRHAVRTDDTGLIPRLAIYFGEEKNFRELAFLLTAELAVIAGNDENTGALVERIIRTPMDIPLWLEYYSGASKEGSKPGREVRKHLDILFNKLDEYMYSRSPVMIQQALRDALRWLRPRPAGRSKKALFTAILRDRIRPRTSWEQEWQALYQQHYDSAEQRHVVLRGKWKEGISSFRIGYELLLDNLRAMLCAGVSGKVLKLAAEYLGNTAAVKRSGTNPLRLLEVYRTLHRMDQSGAGMLTEALEKAVAYSTWGQSSFGSTGISLIAMDVSNSMRRTLHSHVTSQCFDVAPLLAMVWKNRGSQVITGIIGNTWKALEFPARPTLATVDEFRAHEGEAGYAINAWLILQALLRRKQIVDRVLIFTDCRLWGYRRFHQQPGADLGRWWRRYREQLAPHARLYLVDLPGHTAGNVEMLPDDVFVITGWKERLMDILEIIDAGPDRLALPPGSEHS